MSFLTKHARYVAVSILLLMLSVSLVVSHQESNTFDEKAHIPAAYSYVRYGDMRLNPEHPPLLKDLAGLPLLFFQPAFPLESNFWLEGINEQWKVGEIFLYENGNDADTINFWSRLPIIFVSLLLGWFIYVWTKELAGTLAGLFALTLYAFDPNILAHNHYVTTDIGIAAFLFVATYFFIRFLKQSTIKNTLLFGLFLGLAQLAKFSAVLLFPLFGLILIVFALSRHTLTKDNPESHRSVYGFIFEYLWKYVVAIMVCFLLIDIVYTLNTWNMPVEKIQSMAQNAFSDQGLGKPAKSFIQNISAIPLLKPLSEYFLGVFMVFARVTGGNTYYFLGTVSNQASPLYFPTVFLLKETIPFLFLLFASLTYTLIHIGKSLQEKGTSWKRTIALSIHENISQYTMASFVLLYAYLSITGNLNIGFRHLFPILPFLYVLTAKTVFDFLKRRKASSQSSPSSPHLLSYQTFTTILGILVFWIAAIPVLAFPNYLPYFNEAAGGSANGYRYATDSNYDWGQDLKRLSVWVDHYNACIENKNKKSLFSSCEDLTSTGIFPTRTPISTLNIDYFGGSRPSYYFGEHFSGWHAGMDPSPGWFAISATFYQESLHKAKQTGEKNYEWLTRYTPVGRAGESIFIFYVSPESLHQ